MKEQSIIMLLRNLNLNDGFSNETRLFITKIREHVLEAQILTRKNKETIVFIPRIVLIL